MIINVAHTKGGVGKTTIATNIAVNLNCPILDLDFQGSSARFNELRDESLPELKIYTATESIQGEAFDFLNKAKGNKQIHVVIDSGGMDNNLIREGIIYSDIIITPVSISQVEFFGLQDFEKLLEDQKEKVYVILNNINLQAKNNILVAQNFIEENIQFHLMKTMLASRVAYKEAYGEGKSVTEYDPTSKAAQEIKKLITEIKIIIGAL